MNVGSPTRAVSPAEREHLGRGRAVWSTGEGLEVEEMGIQEMEMQRGRETEAAKTQNTGLNKMVSKGMDIEVALLMETGMAVDLQDRKERGLPLGTLVREDLDSTEAAQEVMCGKGGSIQKGQAPAAGRD